MSESKRQAPRDDFIPKDAYISPDFASLEKERLWPRVWQMACREEEIPNAGDFVTYDILDDSIIVVRSDNGAIRAFHNVCQHRGRRLTNGCGNASRLRCRFHGWTYGLNGRIETIPDREDWVDCPNTSDEDLSLKAPLVDTWGGFVFINMDTGAEPLLAYLEPIPTRFDEFEYEKMRFHWYKTVRLPCNWKVALEAFNEGYHLATTHPQLLDTMGDDRTNSFRFGKHGMFGYFEKRRTSGAPSPRTGKPVPEDLRPGMISSLDKIYRQFNALITARTASAVHRLLTEASADDDAATLQGKMGQFIREAALAEGIEWPPASYEAIANAGASWHVFANLVFLPGVEAMVSYRARPYGDDPDSCIFDIWSLQRFAPGAEPALKREYYLDTDDWRSEEVFGKVLSQDFQNMGNVQQGMKSRAFSAARPNPKQEVPVSNFHRVLHEYLFPSE